MLKRNFSTRIAAGVLAVIVAMTTALSGVGSTVTAEAASTWTADNLLVNPDFEEDRAFQPAGGSHEGNWFYWQSASKTAEDSQSGSACVKFTGSESSLEQDVTGLVVGATYVYSIWAKVNGVPSSEHVIGVKNYGGSEIKRPITSTEWQKYEIEFVYTSGNPRVYGWVNNHEGVDMYIDNASLIMKSDLQSVSIQNGQLTVTYADAPAQEPTAADFSANYYVGSDSTNSAELALTTAAWDAGSRTLTMGFPEIAKLPGTEQTVTVNLSYGTGQTIQLDFTVAAGEGEAVTANLVSVTAENGQITAVLDENPTVAPVQDDFTWEYKIGDGTYKALSVENFAYNSDAKTVTVDFDEFRSTTEQTASVRVTYGEVSKEAAFTVPASAASTYYVDSTLGDDANNGLTPEKAFASIDKLNTIPFLPGDQILFKKGETFVGCFKPQGSGTETAPITIGSYGEGTERPVLQPGEDWTVDYIMSADSMVRNAKVNYVLQFYNVEYWEVSDLEIMDPNSDAYLTQGSGKWIGNSANAVYRSGITVQAEDIGILEHIYIDNVIIHGFHGPGTNIGKTTGGITMNVITNGDRNRALSVPTQINDIRVTNCEIYDVGRSGINFLTPWSFRTEEKWGPFDYGTRGYDYLPYEDFYMANNYIHDIDGDGTIIDNCSGAVAEYNLVTKCCLRPATTGGGAAVGLFNWNSDDTTFQFNEVYDIRPGAGATASNDSQGIEIDALNDRTWVQYNYVHDNTGGFMMLCNIDDSYRSFDGIVRYNISQNDYAHPRQGLFDIYSANYGTEIYNNTFYLTDRALKPNSDQIFLFSAVGAYETMKFYNNIFYYDGTPAAANTFGDGSIDWQSNIFYGFTNLPENDNPGAPNRDVDPKLVNAGAGGTGTAADVVGQTHEENIGWVDLSCYKLQADSPAIDAGVPLENNGGRDYFGNELTRIPDIGAYESGSVVLKLLSHSYEVNQDELTITVNSNDKVTAEQLLNSLIYEEGVAVELKRGSGSLSGGVRVADGDTVTLFYNARTNNDRETITYTVELVTEEASKVIPVSEMAATAGSAETSQSNDKAENVLDGNIGTIWHTAWGGAAAADRYITIELTNDYEVSGYVYTPRADSGSGGVNGIITKYAIYTSNDNATWTKAAEGSWAQDSTVKTVDFDTPVQAKYIKLLAVESVHNFASAAEIRLIGERVYSDTEAPTAPVVSKGEVTGTSAVIQWNASTDNVGVVEYQLMQDGEVIATFESDCTSFNVTDLQYDTEYTFSVVAVDEAGNVSVAGSVTLTTLKAPVTPTEPDKTELQKQYDQYAGKVSEKANYTEASWSKFEQAMKAADDVLKNDAATQEQINAALNNLNSAYQGLEKKAVTPPPTDPGNNNNNNNNQNSGSNTNTGSNSNAGTSSGTSSSASAAPATGDNANAAAYAVLILFAGCIGAAAMIRKRRNV